MKNKLFIFCLLLLPFLCNSCDEDDVREVVFDEVKFEENRSKWEQLNLQNYSYEYLNSGYSYTGIASHIKVEIEKGEELSATPLVENGIQLEDPYLIDDLFEQIAGRYPKDGVPDLSQGSYLKEIDVKYDENYHFPVEVHYIYHVPEGVEGIWNMHQYIKSFSIKD